MIYFIWFKGFTFSENNILLKTWSHFQLIKNSKNDKVHYTFNHGYDLYILLFVLGIKVQMLCTRHCACYNATDFYISFRKPCWSDARRVSALCCLDESPQTELPKKIYNCKTLHNIKTRVKLLLRQVQISFCSLTGKSTVHVPVWT